MSEDLSSLGLVDLFDRLTMPEPPPPVSMWPQTVGWIWLGLGVALLLAFATWRFIAWRQATAYRRAALAELQGAGDDPVAIAKILRRTALSTFPRDAVAGLHGADWLAFLDKTTDKVRFEGTQAGQVLVRAPYRPEAPNSDLRSMAETWVRTHRAAEVSG